MTGHLDEPIPELDLLALALGAAGLGCWREWDSLRVRAGEELFTVRWDAEKRRLALQGNRAYHEPFAFYRRASHKSVVRALKTRATQRAYTRERNRAQAALERQEREWRAQREQTRADTQAALQRLCPGVTAVQLGHSVTVTVAFPGLGEAEEGLRRLDWGTL